MKRFRAPNPKLGMDKILQTIYDDINQISQKTVSEKPSSRRDKVGDITPVHDRRSGVYAIDVQFPSGKKRFLSADSTPTEKAVTTQVVAPEDPAAVTSNPGEDSNHTHLYYDITGPVNNYLYIDGTGVVTVRNIAGVKSDIGIASGAQNGLMSTALFNKLNGLPDTAVDLTTDQNVGGIKTFTSGIRITNTVKSAGIFYASATDPTATNRLNYDGGFFATQLHGTLYGNGANITGLSADGITTGVLNTARGGTGLSVLTTDYMLVATGPSAYALRAPVEVRTLIAAEPAFSKGNLIPGQNVTLTGTLTSRLVGSGDIGVNIDLTSVSYIEGSGIFIGVDNSINVDASVVRTTGAQTIAGVKTFSSAITISGVTKASGYFYGGTSSPTNTGRLNYDGYLYATQFHGNGENINSLSASNISSGVLNTSRMSADTIPHRATSLPGGVDLNTYLDGAGFMFQASNANAVSGFNYPVDLAGSLLVMRHAGTAQQYQTYDPTPEFFFRSEYQDTWSPWRKVWHDGNFSPSDYALLASSPTFTGTVTADGFQTDPTNTNYSVFSRAGTTAYPLYVQQGSATGNIARFAYNGAVPASGTAVFNIAHNVIDAFVQISGTSVTLSQTLDVSGNTTVGLVTSKLTANQQQIILGNSAGTSVNGQGYWIYDSLGTSRTAVTWRTGNNLGIGGSAWTAIELLQNTDITGTLDVSGSIESDSTIRSLTDGSGVYQFEAYSSGGAGSTAAIRFHKGGVIYRRIGVMPNSNYVSVFQGNTFDLMDFQANNVLFNIGVFYSTLRTTGGVIKAEWDGSYIQSGTDTNGLSAVMGNTRNSSTGVNDYKAYFAYDCYFDDVADNWVARRTSIARKWVLDMGYHTDKFRIRRYDGVVTSPWADSAWTELFSVNSSGRALMTQVHIAGGALLTNAAGNSLRVTTLSGWTEIGPQNSTWSHFLTDRGKFYFNKPVHAVEGFTVYNTSYGISSAGDVTGRNFVGNLGEFGNNFKVGQRAGIDLPTIKSGLVITGEAGIVNAPQNGTERIPILQFQDRRNDYGSGTATPGEIRGGIEWHTNEGTLPGPGVGSAIYQINENTYNSTFGIAFYTGTTASFSERMRISNTGNVGIGRTSPSATLDIDSGTTSTQIHLRNSGTLIGYLNATTGEMRVLASSGAKLGLWTNGAERVYINSAGAVHFNHNVTGNGLFDINSLTVAATSTFNSTLNYTVLNGPATSTRDKVRVHNSSSYAIGMQSGITLGGLGDWAMTFQMNSDFDRGFWWGDSSHTTAQGAMALTTEGKLTVAHSIRLGYGEADTTVPGATYRLDVSGAGRFTGISYASDHADESDRRLKSNLQRHNALDIAHYCTLYKYDKKGLDRKQYGIIAQDIMQYDPDLGIPRPDDTFGEIFNLSAYSIASIALVGVNEVDNKVDKLTKRIHELEDKVRQLGGTL